MSGRLQVLSGVLLVAAALSALPAAAQAASSTISITVPPTQLIEGTTSLVVSAGVPVQRGRLTIKSNIPWVLVARATGAMAMVDWRDAHNSTWRQLGANTPVLQGAKGVHEVEYEARISLQVVYFGQPVIVTFSVEPAPAPW